MSSAGDTDEEFNVIELGELNDDVSVVSSLSPEVEFISGEARDVDALEDVNEERKKELDNLIMMLGNNDSIPDCEVISPVDLSESEEKYMEKVAATNGLRFENFGTFLSVRKVNVIPELKLQPPRRPLTLPTEIFTVYVYLTKESTDALKKLFDRVPEFNVVATNEEFRFHGKNACVSLGFGKDKENGEKECLARRKIVSDILKDQLEDGGRPVKLKCVSIKKTDSVWAIGVELPEYFYEDSLYRTPHIIFATKQDYELSELNFGAWKPLAEENRLLCNGRVVGWAASFPYVITVRYRNLNGDLPGLKQCRGCAFICTGDMEDYCCIHCARADNWHGEFCKRIYVQEHRDTDKDDDGGMADGVLREDVILNMNVDDKPHETLGDQLWELMGHWRPEWEPRCRADLWPEHWDWDGPKWDEWQKVMDAGDWSDWWDSDDPIWAEWDKMFLRALYEPRCRADLWPEHWDWDGPKWDEWQKVMDAGDWSDWWDADDPIWDEWYKMFPSKKVKEKKEECWDWGFDDPRWRADLWPEHFDWYGPEWEEWYKVIGDGGWSVWWEWDDPIWDEWFKIVGTGGWSEWWEWDDPRWVEWKKNFVPKKLKEIQNKEASKDWGWKDPRWRVDLWPRHWDWHGPEWEQWYKILSDGGWSEWWEWDDPIWDEWFKIKGVEGQYYSEWWEWDDPRWDEFFIITEDGEWFEWWDYEDPRWDEWNETTCVLKHKVVSRDGEWWDEWNKTCVLKHKMSPDGEWWDYDDPRWDALHEFVVDQSKKKHEDSIFEAAGLKNLWVPATGIISDICGTCALTVPTHFPWRNEDDQLSSQCCNPIGGSKLAWNMDMEMQRMLRSAADTRARTSLLARPRGIPCLSRNVMPCDHDGMCTDDVTGASGDAGTRVRQRDPLSLSGRPNPRVAWASKSGRMSMPHPLRLDDNALEFAREPKPNFFLSPPPPSPLHQLHSPNAGLHNAKNQRSQDVCPLYIPCAGRTLERSRREHEALPVYVPGCEAKKHLNPLPEVPRFPLAYDQMCKRCLLLPESTPGGLCFKCNIRVKKEDYVGDGLEPRWESLRRQQEEILFRLIQEEEDKKESRVSPLPAVRVSPLPALRVSPLGAVRVSPLGAPGKLKVTYPGPLIRCKRDQCNFLKTGLEPDYCCLGCAVGDGHSVRCEQKLDAQTEYATYGRFSHPHHVATQSVSKGGKTPYCLPAHRRGKSPLRSWPTLRRKATLKASLPTPSFIAHHVKQTAVKADDRARMVHRRSEELLKEFGCRHRLPLPPKKEEEQQQQQESPDDAGGENTGSETQEVKPSVWGDHHCGSQYCVYGQTDNGTPGFCCRGCACTKGRTHDESCDRVRREPIKAKIELIPMVHDTLARYRFGHSQQCPNCAYELTGCFPNFCCSSCRTTPGTHAPNCLRLRLVRAGTIRDKRSGAERIKFAINFEAPEEAEAAEELEEVAAYWKDAEQKKRAGHGKNVSFVLEEHENVPDQSTSGKGGDRKCLKRPVSGADGAPKCLKTTDGVTGLVDPLTAPLGQDDQDCARAESLGSDFTGVMVDELVLDATVSSSRIPMPMASPLSRSSHQKHHGVSADVEMEGTPDVAANNASSCLNDVSHDEAAHSNGSHTATTTTTTVLEEGGEDASTVRDEVPTGEGADTIGDRCTHADCAFAQTGIIAGFCCKKCATQSGEHGPKCLKRPHRPSGSVSIEDEVKEYLQEVMERIQNREAAKQQEVAGSSSVGTKCSHCSFAQTGIQDGFCCKKCAKVPGAHGPKCEWKPVAHDDEGGNGKCAHCEHPQTGILPGFCCKTCAKRPGSHGWKCASWEYQIDGSDDDAEEEKKQAEDATMRHQDVGDGHVLVVDLTCGTIERVEEACQNVADAGTTIIVGDGKQEDVHRGSEHHARARSKFSDIIRSPAPGTEKCGHGDCPYTQTGIIRGFCCKSCAGYPGYHGWRCARVIHEVISPFNDAETEAAGAEAEEQAESQEPHARDVSGSIEQQPDTFCPLTQSPERVPEREEEYNDDDAPIIEELTSESNDDEESGDCGSHCGFTQSGNLVPGFCCKQCKAFPNHHGPKCHRARGENMGGCSSGERAHTSAVRESANPDNTTTRPERMLERRTSSSPDRRRRIMFLREWRSWPI